MAVPEIRHRRRPVHPVDAATAGDRWLVGDRRVDDSCARRPIGYPRPGTPHRPGGGSCVPRTGRRTRAYDVSPIPPRCPVSPGLRSSPPPPPSAPERTGTGGRGASRRRRPGAHSTAGDEWRDAPVRLRPLVRTSRSHQPGRVHRDDTPSDDVDRRTAGMAGRRDARLRSGGLGLRLGPVRAPRGDCPPARVRAGVARGGVRASDRPRRRARLVRHAVAPRCSPTSTRSTSPSGRTPQPSRPGWTSTGTQSRRWCAFSMPRLHFRDAGEPCPFADRSCEAHT